VNVNDHSPVTELQVTTCVFGSTYVFHRIAEGLAVCRFCGFLYDLLFGRYNLKSSTPYFPNKKDRSTRRVCIRSKVVLAAILYSESAICRVSA